MNAIKNNNKNQRLKFKHIHTYSCCVNFFLHLRNLHEHFAIYMLNSLLQSSIRRTKKKTIQLLNGFRNG